jgi:CRISPR-associated protein Csx17
MPELALPGCTPEPLMNYLKALGVFRLVAEQADSNARLSWRSGIAHLHSTLDRDSLEKFFLKKYRPTPIVAPWNGGSGFYGGGADPLEAILSSDSSRFEPYRETIARIRAFVPQEKPKDNDKDSLLVRCRQELSDEVVPWLDVCFVLGEDGPRFFPLLGTGGNDGRLDFTNNYMQRVADVIPLSATGEVAGETGALLAASLFTDNLVSLGKSAIGQFNPGGIGGANGTQGGFEAGSQVNAWDYVLMIEGSLLFAGSVARRMGSNTSNRAVFPFTVESVAVGYGSATASEETSDGSRAELWLPLWNRDCAFSEVTHLFAEGRAQIGRRQARNSVQFALAANLLGVSRGITSFARYGFLKRNGLAFLAAPLGRVEVHLRPQARLLEDLPMVEWVDRLRRACSDKEKTAARYQTALRQIDRAFFEFTSRSELGNDTAYLLNVLRAVGNAEFILANGLRFCADKFIRPLQRLSSQWLQLANDESPEFRLAAALSSLRKQDSIGPIRAYLEQVEFKGMYADWSPGSTSAVWSNRPLAGNLAAVFLRRQMEAYRSGFDGIPLDSLLPARLDDVLAFLNAETDDQKLSDLLWGMICVNTSKAAKPEWVRPTRQVNFEFGVPRLVTDKHIFRSHRVHIRHRQTNREETRIQWRLSTAGGAIAESEPEAFHILASGRSDAITRSVDFAARRLKSGGLLVNGYRNRQQSGRSLSIESQIAPERLLAAMLFPLSKNDLNFIANQVLYPPQTEE